MEADFYRRHPKALQLALALCLEEKGRRESTGDLLVKYRDDPVGFITDGLGQCREPSWNPWLTVLRAAYGLGHTFDEEELAFFKSISGDRDPPPGRVKELWLIVGRRGGKDSIASLIALNNARFADCVALRPGERALVACFAVDRTQAGIVFNYIKGYFEEIPRLGRWLSNDLPASYRAGAIELTNRTDISVSTNNFRAPRGRAIATAVFDEVAFWRDENSATPDKETYRAVRPGMATVPDAMLVGISTPHRQAGLLWEKYQRYFGKDDADTLVILAPTRTMNPMIDEINPGLIEKELEDDPELARAEYFCEFRKDLVDYVQREIVEACTPRGITELQPIYRQRYVGFVDPSGGSRDSMTCAIAHSGGDKAVLDRLLERRSPFSPESVVDEFAEELLKWGVTSVTGDRYAGEWPREQFQKRGISYVVSEISKSEIYRDFLPVLNSKKVQLLDIPRLTNQLCGLERRTVRGGRDSIDHAPGAMDDCINAAAGALLLIASDKLAVWDRLAA